VCGVGAFEEVGEVSRVVAELPEEGDVLGKVVADEYDFALFGGVDGGGGFGKGVGERGLETVGDGFGGVGDFDPFTCPVGC
jgi:hypothetical protein